MSVLFYSEKEPFYEFSNYYARPVKFDGKTYPSTEHYYQAQKFLGPAATAADQAYAEIIRQASTPNKARYLALQKARGGYAASWYLSATNKAKLNDLIKQSHVDKVTLRSDWEIVKDQIMRIATWGKYTQHSDLKELLVGTGDKFIAENSPRDPYWGLGKDGKGSNMLGRVLMEVRGFLTGTFPKPPTDNSNWIIPEFLLASAYPGAKDPIAHKKIVNALKKLPITLYLSLQEAKEEQNFNSYRKIIAKDFTEPTSKGFCEQVDKTIFARVPIPDRKVISDNYLVQVVDVIIDAIGKHHKVLVHCFGGKGRTGTLIGVLLGRMYGMTATEAIDVMTQSFAKRKNKGLKKPTMPQTKVQYDQIKRILSEPKTSKYTLAIVGSRDFTDKNLFAKVIDNTLQDWNLQVGDIKAIVSGGAKGADTLAKQFAKQYSLKLIEYLPDWDTHGKAAGPLRNKKIIAAATHVIAFPSTNGKGTQNSINLAKKAGLPLKIQYIDKPVASAEPPTVVCIKKAVLTKEGYKDLEDWLAQNPNHLYIGRNMSFYVKGANASKWKNPYSLKKYSLEESLKLYKEYVVSSPELFNSLAELGGKVLGCWCKPSGCHGDALRELYIEHIK